MSQAFFESAPEEAPPSAEFPESEREVLYLTPEQVSRKRAITKLVGVVVGVLAALVVIILVKTFATTSPAPSGSAAPAPTPTRRAPEGEPSAVAPSPEPAPLPAPEPAPAPSASASADAAAGGGPPSELPDVEDPYKELFALVNAGQNEKAIPFGYAAIKKDPENGDAYYLLGEALRGLGRMDEAKQVFKQCVEKATRGQYKSYCSMYVPK